MLGRNDKCHCGSGKKYKKCCMDKEPMRVIKQGVNLFMYGNGPKAPMEEIEQRIKEMKEELNTVDTSKIEVGVDGVNSMPTELFGTSLNGNIAIEIFIGYAKRDDTTEEEVKKVYELVKEVVELGAKVFKMSPIRLKYYKDLEVLIKDKKAKVEPLAYRKDLIDSYDAWFKAFGTRPMTNYKVTILDILEGVDTIKETYQKDFEARSIEYMTGVFKELGYGINLETAQDKEKMDKLHNRIKDFDRKVSKEYYSEVKKRLEELQN